jgi:hypothetical protein
MSHGYMYAFAESHHMGRCDPATCWSHLQNNAHLAELVKKARLAIEKQRKSKSTRVFAVELKDLAATSDRKDIGKSKGKDSAKDKDRKRKKKKVSAHDNIQRGKKIDTSISPTPSPIPMKTAPTNSILQRLQARRKVQHSGLSRSKKTIHAKNISGNSASNLQPIITSYRRKRSEHGPY